LNTGIVSQSETNTARSKIARGDVRELAIARRALLMLYSAYGGTVPPAQEWNHNGVERQAKEDDDNLERVSE
jgi:hypothetical protein